MPHCAPGNVSNSTPGRIKQEVGGMFSKPHGWNTAVAISAAAAVLSLSTAALAAEATGRSTLATAAAPRVVDPSALPPVGPDTKLPAAIPARPRSGLSE